jgi:hypothetical protein
VRARVRDGTFTRTATSGLDAAGESGVIFSPQWDDSAFLWYHLLRPDTAWPDVMLAHALPDSVLVRYLGEGREFVLPHEGRTVTAGRPVYVVGTDMAAKVAAVGFATREVLTGLFLVEKP